MAPLGHPFIAFYALAFAGGVAALASDAQAQTPCAPRDQVIAQLEDEYGETRRGVGLQNRGAVVEVYASDATGTWSILVTRPDGVACLVAAGEAWIETEAAPGPAL